MKSLVRCATRVRSLVSVLIGLLLLIGAGALFAQDIAQRDGMRLSFARLSSANDEVPGFVRFLVVAENTTPQARSVHAKILLEVSAPQPAETDAKASGAEAGVSATEAGTRTKSCTVYLEVPPRSSEQLRLACEADNPSDIRYEIVRVFDFTLEPEAAEETPKNDAP